MSSIYKIYVHKNERNYLNRNSFKKKVNKRLKLLIEGIIAIIVIIFLLSKLNVGEIINILKETNLLLLILAILFFLISFFLTVLGVKILFDSIHPLSFKEWVKYSLCGFSLGLIFPGRAGDLSIIYLAKKKGFDYGTSTALTLVDKISTLIIFGIIAGIGSFTILKSTELYLGLIVGALFIILGLFLFTPTGRKIIRAIIGKYAIHFKGFNKAFTELIKNHKWRLFLNIIITLVRPIINGLVTVILFKAIGIDVSFLFAIIISTITIIVSLVPLTPNGIGIKEGVGIYLFTILGISAEAAASMYALTLAIYLSLGVIGITLYTLELKKEI